MFCMVPVVDDKRKMTVSSEDIDACSSGTHRWFRIIKWSSQFMRGIWQNWSAEDVWIGFGMFCFWRRSNAEPRDCFRIQIQLIRGQASIFQHRHLGHNYHATIAIFKLQGQSRTLHFNAQVVDSFPVQCLWAIANFRFRPGSGLIISRGSRFPGLVMSTLLYREIQFITQATLTALSKNCLEACLFGSAAAAICGMEYRIPKVCSHSVSDADVIVAKGIT